MVIWHILSRFVMLYQEQSGNPEFFAFFVPLTNWRVRAGWPDWANFRLLSHRLLFGSFFENYLKRQFFVLLSFHRISRCYVKGTNANMPNAKVPNDKVPNILKTTKCRNVKLSMFYSAEPSNCRSFTVPNRQIVDVLQCRNIQMDYFIVIGPNLT
jgi:hypothetical protein